MTEDTCPKVAEETISTAATTTKQRKKRKWDQPAEFLISAGLAVPAVLPLTNIPLVGMTVPGAALLSGSVVVNTIPALPPGSLPNSVQQNAAAMAQKLNQPKIQDELIAREIVINDAEPTIRYRLTKRQTQEEIQRYTGAVVITRGKYRSPNAVPDSEKPLYLHISAGAHLKETAERIKAVDRAAAMVEEMLKHGQISYLTSTPSHSANNIAGQVSQLLNVSVFMGFNADPFLNIATRIRGPKDQYINHIMNETGATVILRGRGSGNFQCPNGEESQQPLHLYLSCNTLKGLENAKLLAENLMDTIAAECGASRVSSSKVYNAVPPPQQLLDGVQSSTVEERVNAGLASSTLAVSGPVPGVIPLGTVSQPGVLPSCGQPQPNMVCYSQPFVSGTSYSGYGGIYPQATPLQQVALALRQSPSPGTSVCGPATPAGNTLPKENPKNDSERRIQRRKFQELPAASKEPENPHQNLPQALEFHKPCPSPEASSLTNVSTMPPPKKLVQSSSNGMLTPPKMLPPPPRTMPPPPPKVTSSTPLTKGDGYNIVPTKSTSKPVPDLENQNSLQLSSVITCNTHLLRRCVRCWGLRALGRGSLRDAWVGPKLLFHHPTYTLIKLMEYGEDDDDPEGSDDKFSNCALKPMTAPKPFWAL